MPVSLSIGSLSLSLSLSLLPCLPACLLALPACPAVSSPARRHYELINRTKATVYVNWAACKNSDEHAALVRPGATLVIAGLVFHVIGKVTPK
jgi:hypothetical protein